MISSARNFGNNLFQETDEMADPELDLVTCGNGRFMFRAHGTYRDNIMLMVLRCYWLH